MGNQWSTQFIPDKCEVIGTTKQTSTIVYPYKEHNIDLKTKKMLGKKEKEKKYKGKSQQNMFKISIRILQYCFAPNGKNHWHMKNGT